jgi:hypothetical protein
MEIITSLHNPFKQLCLKGFPLFFTRDSTKSVLVCADPRGGSTWLTEMLLTEQKLELIWEPLHLKHNTLFNQLRFCYRQHIPERTVWPEAKEAFARVFTGRNLNLWTTLYTSLHQLIKSERLLVKMCRAGLMLPWLTESFVFERKPIFMIRHPFAVVASQLRHNGWQKLTSTYPIPDSPFNDIYLEHQPFLQNLTTSHEILTATWCLTNSYILNHPKNNINWISLTYEHLLMEPIRQLTRVYEQWNMEMPAGMVEKVMLPSKTVIDSSPVHNTDLLLQQWRKYFNEFQIEDMLKILGYFNITLYDKSLLPHSRFI